MAARPPVEARYSRFHNLSMTLVAVAMVIAAILYMARQPENAPAPTFTDTRFVLFLVLGVAMAFYAFVGIRRFLDRAPQVTIDRDGILLGFGRNRRFTWDEIRWVKLHRLAVRPQLHIGIEPETFVTSDLRLSMWNLDDAMRPIRGVPAAIAVRDNGLDTRAAALLDAVRSFRPNLVKS
ncbi:MAG: hypothetical protein EXR12_14095 [Rhodospirillaceae bacterium]|nr:hypothetical protein [Rhodospirillaceae bacterium]